MEHLTITIELDNDAFVSDYTGQKYKETEINRVLRQCIKNVYEDKIPNILFDINGNKCGEIQYYNIDTSLKYNQAIPDKVKHLLDSLNMDCHMAINGEWDCGTDEGK